MFGKVDRLETYRSASHVRVVSAGKLRGFLVRGRWCGLDLKIPVSLNRQFSHMVRVVSAKMPRPLAFARHVEAEIMKVQKPRSATLNGKLHTARYFEVFGEGTRLAMPKTICGPDSSSLKPSSGATEEVLDLGVLGQPDYILCPDCWTMKIQD